MNLYFKMNLLNVILLFNRCCFTSIPIILQGKFIIYKWRFRSVRCMKDK